MKVGQGSDQGDARVALRLDSAGAVWAAGLITHIRFVGAVTGTGRGHPPGSRFIYLVHLINYLSLAFIFGGH